VLGHDRSLLLCETIWALDRVEEARVVGSLIQPDAAASR
jgi:hypothetical protein